MLCNAGLVFVVHEAVRQVILRKLGGSAWHVHSELATHLGNAGPDLSHDTAPTHGWRFCQVQLQHLYAVMLTPLKRQLTKVQICQNECINAGLAVSKAAQRDVVQEAEETHANAEVAVSALQLFQIHHQLSNTHQKLNTLVAGCF